MDDRDDEILAPHQAIRLEQLGRQPIDVELHHDVVAPEAIGGSTQDLALIAAGYVENLTFSSMALLWEPNDIGLVSGVLGCIRTAMAALSLSMYISILNTELDKHLPRYLIPAALQAGLPDESLPALLVGARIGSFAAMPGINETVT